MAREEPESPARSLARSLATLCWEVRPHGHHLAWVEGPLQSWLGIAPTALAQDPLAWRRFLHPEDRQRVDAQPCVADLYPKDCTIRVSTLLGTWRSLRLRTVQQTDSDNILVWCERLPTPQAPAPTAPSLRALWCLDFELPLRLDLGLREREQAFLATARVAESNSMFERLSFFDGSPPALDRPLAEIPGTWLPGMRRFWRSLAGSDFARRQHVVDAMGQRDKPGSLHIETEGLVIDGALHQLWCSTFEAPPQHKEPKTQGQRLPASIGIAVFDGKRRLLRCNLALQRMGMEAIGQAGGPAGLPIDTESKANSAELFDGAREHGFAQCTANWNHDGEDPKRVNVALSFEDKQDGRYFLCVEDATSEGHAHGARMQPKEEREHPRRLGNAGAMAARVAHELSQPLAAIVNYTRGCALRLPEGERWQAIRNALEAANTQALLAGDSLKRMRSFATQRAPSLSRVQLKPFLERSAELFCSTKLGPNVEVVLDLRLTSECIRADPDQLQQGLHQLLENAAEACPQAGGQIQLSALATASNPSQVAIKVRDNGPGVDNSVRERLFLPFESTKPSSLGLGLSIARNIVESHGGLLACERWGPNQTTFTITLNLLSS